MYNDILLNKKIGLSFDILKQCSLNGKLDGKRDILYKMLLH
jgi:hypothetical protein